MKAWVVREYGAPEKLRFEDVAEPPESTDRVRLSVRASAVNFADALAIAGTYQVKPELPFIPGQEVAGVVLETPPDSGLSAGDRVAAFVSGQGLVEGGYTEMTLATPSRVTKIPDEMPFEDGAAFFGIYQTAWFALHRRGAVRNGEVVLVHAGAGGVGSAAIQVAKAAGARVIATAGSPEKTAVCRSLGADIAVDYRADDFVAAVKEFTGGSGADVVIDPVGGDVFTKSTKCIAFEGRLVVVGFAGGDIPSLVANHVMVKNYSVLGLFFGAYLQRMPQVASDAARELLGLYGVGAIKPHISSTAPLDCAIETLTAVASRKTTGKVVLTVGP